MRTRRGEPTPRAVVSSRDPTTGVSVAVQQYSTLMRDRGARGNTTVPLVPPQFLMASAHACMNDAATFFLDQRQIIADRSRALRQWQNAVPSDGEGDQSAIATSRRQSSGGGGNTGTCRPFGLNETATGVRRAESTRAAVPLDPAASPRSAVQQPTQEPDVVASSISRRQSRRAADSGR